MPLDDNLHWTLWKAEDKFLSALVVWIAQTNIAFAMVFLVPNRCEVLGYYAQRRTSYIFCSCGVHFTWSSVLAPLEPVLRSNKCFRMYCCSLWGFLDIVYDEVLRHYSHGLIFQIRLKFLAQPWSQFVKESLSHQLHITPAIQQQYAFSGSCIHMSAVLQQTMKILYLHSLIPSYSDKSL